MRTVFSIILLSLFISACKAETPAAPIIVNAPELVDAKGVSEAQIIEEVIIEETKIAEIETVQESAGAEVAITNATAAVKTNVKNVTAESDKSSETSEEPQSTTGVISDIVRDTPITQEVSGTETNVPQPTAGEVIVDKENKAVDKIEVELSLPALHEAWHELLQQYVSSSGQVDYKGLKTNENTLDNYLNALKDKRPAMNDLSGAAMAYWINAYNAFTVKLILKNYPVGSITDLHGGKPWDQKWISLGGETYSLNNIEHDILRPNFKDARIHFAVNCAAKSCPKLSNVAFTGDNTDVLLDKLSGEFVNNAAANTIGKNKVELSKIFEWYGEDFEDLIGFLNKYAEVKIAANATVSYRNYDWALNSK